MDSIAKFRRRSQRNGKTQKEIMVNELKRNFNKHVDESLAGFEVQATIPDEVSITEETRTIKSSYRLQKSEYFSTGISWKRFPSR